MAQTKTIEQDLKLAMKARDKLKVSVLRMVLAALHNEEIARKKLLSEEEVNAVLGKEVKKRQEAIELYQQAKRQELVDKETQEMVIIRAYMPAMMGEAEVKALILQLKAKGKWVSDFGQAMKLVLTQVKGRAEGKTVAQAVKSSL
ncbi:MAG: GatB/YqeY domain-containing protein [Candidatus Beckwithbacteria bacterium]